ncbi:MAG: hypothetical protein HY843_09300 [Bdellovibrio sp.]|nr:hypothetical protein [Bdellovibrio sp.]
MRDFTCHLHDGTRWIIVFILSLFLNFFILFFVQKNTFHQPKTVPFEMETISPSQVEALKKLWQEEKTLLLHKDNQHQTLVPPKNAHFFSDQNISVDREQKAALTSVLPRKSANTFFRTNKHLSPVGLNTQSMDDQSIKTPGEQTILDKDLPAGSENLLNTQESIYYSFYARIYETIAPIWLKEINSITSTVVRTTNDYITIVDVVLDKDGNVIGVTHLQDCIIEEFNQAADSPWHLAKRFPNPPTALLNEKEEMHLEFRFTVSVSKQLSIQLMPSQQFY